MSPTVADRPGNAAGPPIVERLHALLAGTAAHIAVKEVTLGLGYTAVALEDGSVGVAYTWIRGKACCSFARGWTDAEGGPALALLDLLPGSDGLGRSVGMATVNALNHRAALSLPRDEGPAGAAVRELGITAGTRVAMVGFFPPVARALEALGASLKVVDDDKGMGDHAAFEAALAEHTDVLIVTSTALLNDTAGALLALAGPRVRAAMLGPTTPLVAEAFAGTQVEVLAGMAPVDTAAVLRAVRHGAGAPELLRLSRKVYCRCGGGA